MKHSKLSQYIDFLAQSELSQMRDVNWYIEQATCGDWEQYVESEFIDTIEQLIPLTQYPKVRKGLIEGYKLYWWGEKWKVVKEWLPFLYFCDKTIKLPLPREVIIMDRTGIARCKYFKGEK